MRKVRLEREARMHALCARLMEVFTKLGAMYALAVSHGEVYH